MRTRDTQVLRQEGDHRISRHPSVFKISALIAKQRCSHGTVVSVIQKVPMVSYPVSGPQEVFLEVVSSSLPQAPTKTPMPPEGMGTYGGGLVSLGTKWDRAWL